MAEKGFSFKLFVAGDEHHSSQAVANLHILCETHLKNNYTIEIINIFEDFEAALENNIFLSPALVKTSPGARTVVFGNLADTTKVANALQLGKS